LQTFVLVCAANFLSPNWAAVSQLLYLLLGLTGLPIFSGGGGLAAVVSPSFGYLLSFPLIAWLISHSQHRFRPTSFGVRWTINFCGLILTLILGVLWLYFMAPIWTGNTISPQGAWIYGAAIFLPGEMIKSLFATIVIDKLRDF
jgi:biotin transport system substrate-specific component